MLLVLNGERVRSYQPVHACIANDHLGVVSGSSPPDTTPSSSQALRLGGGITPPRALHAASACSPRRSATAIHHISAVALALHLTLGILNVRTLLPACECRRSTLTSRRSVPALLVATRMPCSRDVVLEKSAHTASRPSRGGRKIQTPRVLRSGHGGRRPVNWTPTTSWFQKIVLVWDRNTRHPR